MTEWQKQRPPNQLWMLQAMLQTALADRCKLVVHRIPAEATGFALMVGKHGPKLKEAKPDEPPHSGGIPLPEGGVVISIKPGQRQEVTYFEISMASLAAHLSMEMGIPFQDKTGLTGKYDFVLAKREDLPPPDGQEAGASGSDLDKATYWDFEALGLELKPVKVPVETIMIVHIERPSAN